MRHVFVLLALVGWAVACNGAKAQSAAASASSPDGKIIQQLMGDKGKAVTSTYRDAEGHSISAQTFRADVEHGRAFNVKHGDKRFVFTLLPSGAKGGADTNAYKPGLKPGQSLPAFQLPMVNGGKALASSLEGRPTLVDFFFADCIGCIEELPALNAYMAQHPDMHFLAITFDDAKTAEAFVRERHFAWPVAYNGKPVFKQLAIHAAPTMLLLDAGGRLLASHAGSIPVSVTTSSKQAPSAPDASVTKTAQVGWLTRWVAKNTAKASR